MTAVKTARREITELINWATSMGWEYDGLSNSGHHTIRWPQTGETVTLSSTPSATGKGGRTLSNARARIRRIGGHPSDSGPAGKYRHRRHTSGFSMDKALAEQQQHTEQYDADRSRAAALEKQHNDYTDELHALRETARRADIPRARWLVAQCLFVEEAARTLGRPIPDPLTRDE